MVQFSRVIAGQQIDVEFLAEVIAAVINQLANLRFGPDGRALNPTNGLPDKTVQLVSGTPGTVSARYLVEDPPNPPDPDVNDPDLFPLIVENVSITDTLCDVRATEARRGAWQLDAAITRRRLPSAQMSFASSLLDLDPQVTQGWGIWSRLLRTQIALSGNVNLAGFADGRSVILSAGGEVGPARVHVALTPEADGIRFDLTVEGIGLARMALVVVGGPVRRLIDEGLDEFITGDDLRAVVEELANGRRAADAAGGVDAWVAQWLWMRTSQPHT